MICYRNWWTYHRNYYIGYAVGREDQEGNTVNTYISDWITLTGGEYYPIKADHYNGGSSGHATVSVEFKQTESTAGHHHAGREIQRLIVGQTVVLEQTKVRVNNISAG